MSNASAWMVHDDSGRIWPPNFRASVHVQKPTNWQLALVQAGAAGEKARQEGRGWGKGTIEGLTKPLIPAGARVTRPYQFRGAVGGHVSCAHAVWSWLRSNPGSM